MIALLLALAPVTVCYDIDGHKLSCKSAWAVDPHWRRPADCIVSDCSPHCAPRTVHGESTACSAWTERLPDVAALRTKVGDEH